MYSYENMSLFIVMLVILQRRKKVAVAFQLASRKKNLATCIKNQRTFDDMILLTIL